MVVSRSKACRLSVVLCAVWVSVAMLGGSAVAGTGVVNLSDNATASFSSSVAASGRHVHVVWSDGTFTAELFDNELMYAHSGDGGLTWVTTYLTALDEGIAIAPAVAVSGSSVHVVFSVRGSSQGGLWYMHSDDSGSAWTEPALLVPLATCCAIGLPEIAADGPNVHIVWDEWDWDDHSLREIFTIRSANNGRTWYRVRQLTNNSVREYSEKVTVMGTGDDAVVIVVFSRNGKAIVARRSIDNGRTWLGVQRVRNFTGMHSGADLFGHDGTVYVAWSDERRTPGSTECYLMKSEDSGVTWLPIQRLTRTAALSTAPQVTATGDEVFVVWTETWGPKEVYFRKSPDAAETWLDAGRISTVPNASGDGDIASAGGKAHIVWEDSETFIDIYYRRRN